MRFFFLFIFSFFSLSIVNAQDTVSFKECLNICFENNLYLKEALYEVEMSGIQLDKNKMNLLPTLNANVSNNNSYGRSIDPYSNSFIDTKFASYSGSVGSNLVLFNGFAKMRSIKIAKNELDLNSTTMEKIKSDLTVELASLYTSILYTTELIYATTEQIEISKKQLTFLQIKFEEGLIAESELFKMEAQIASEETNLISNENVLQVYYLDLKQIMNIPSHDNIILKPLQSILESESQILPILLDTENDYITNPSFKIVQIQEERAKLNIALNRSAYLPSLSLQLNYGSFYSDSNINSNFSEQWNNNKNYGFGLSLSLPIFDGFSTRYNVKIAKVLYQQNKIRTEIEINKLIKVLSQANYDLLASDKKLKSASSAFKYSKKTFEADQLKFEYGKISLTELMLTQKDFYNSKAELIRAKYEYSYNLGVIGFYKENHFDLD